MQCFPKSGKERQCFLFSDEQGFLRCFRDPIRVLRIENRILESLKIIIGSLKSEKIGSLKSEKSGL